MVGWKSTGGMTGDGFVESVGLIGDLFSGGAAHHREDEHDCLLLERQVLKGQLTLKFD